MEDGMIGWRLSLIEYDWRRLRTLEEPSLNHAEHAQFLVIAPVIF